MLISIIKTAAVKGMKKKFELSLLAAVIIVVAFVMAAAIILSCVELPIFREVVRQRINY